MTSQLRTAKEAQEYIASLKPYTPPTVSELKTVEHLKVDYHSVDEMPAYKQKRISFCLQWIIKEYNPENIWLVRSQLDGYPVDEKTSHRDFEKLKKVFGEAKFSDWDFVVNEVETFNRVETISPLVKVDLFQFHHGSCRKMKVYES